MDETQNYFNRAAHIWDSRRLPDSGKIETMLNLSDIRPGAVILDAGCGTGTLESYLLRYNPKHIVAVDFAENMILEAKRKYDDPCLEFICSDIFNMTPNSYKFDYCFFYNAFPHFKDHKALTGHISGLMAPGGRITISHTKGVKSTEGDFTSPGFPAKSVVDVLSDHFRPDVIIDNNVMLMVSAILLTTAKAQKP